MKKIATRFILVFFLFTNLVLIAQEKDNSEEFDLLKAPISPASNLLGFSQSDIDKPTDVSAFMTSLQTATNSFSQLPSNYAIDIAPFWLFKKDNPGDISTKGLSNSSGEKVVKQTLVLSFAVKNTDSISNNFDPASTYAAFGFRFSIYRGEYDSKTKNQLTAIALLQQEKLKLMKDNHIEVYENLPLEIDSLKKVRKAIFIGIDPNDTSDDNTKLVELLYKKADKLDSIISLKIQILLDDNISSKTKNGDSDLNKFKRIDTKIKQLASQFQLARVNFTWDIAGGISAEFRNKNFNNSKVYNSGIWTTFGYTWEKSGSLLGLVRYLYNPDKIFALDNQVNEMNNVSTIDTGVRYIIGKSQSKFNCSIEAIYRSALSKNTTNSSWRLMANADYAILKNQKLTFSFGRNYDGTTSKDGNLIAALGLVFGFGNSR
ncbi:hypothetical protein SGQ83_05890 [Flavobacterium sp. Fl-318]|uniref:DUF3078 domain-containing protein n=1 Tax=Flavobacterium cupriresistens TaxID=2893885 RepID=A0ABU4R8G2_9FLAO|nr:MULTISPECIES: hypothetical protein [unclassified Flavobacterium]MDX6188872.1 hypothetical protein [Flavobacterium sp. Fl-318]UFH44345.1 hypothetical protein LNP23_09015 [Flavobacterium sp. F-323]